MRVDRKAMRDAGDAKCTNDGLGGEAAVEVEGPLEGGLAGGSARQGLPSRPLNDLVSCGSGVLAPWYQVSIPPLRRKR